MRDVIKGFSRLFDREQKKKIAILFVMMLVGAVFEMLGVSLMLPLMTAIMNPDIIETNAAVAWICGVFDLHSYRTFVVLCIIALIAVYIIKDSYLIFEYNVQYRFVFNNRFIVQRRLLHAYMQKDYEFYLAAKSGEIMHTVQGDVGAMFSLFMTILFLATESIVSLGLILTVFAVSPGMTVFVAVALIIAVVVITKVVKPVLRREGVTFRQSSAECNSWLMQSIQGIKEVKVTNTERYFEQNFEESGHRLIDSQRSESVINNVPRLIIEMTCVCSVLLAIAIMIMTGTAVEEVVPALGVFAMAAVKLMPSANRIVGAMNAISYQRPAMDKLLETLDGMGDMDETISEDRQKFASLELKTVDMRDVSYHYPNSEEMIFEDANFTVKDGESIGIVGPSGAGKTTLVDILLGLLKPSAGDVYVNDQSIHDVYGNWLATIGYIPQSIFMLDADVRANVAFGESEDKIDDERVWKALRAAQMEEFVRKLPEGLNTGIGERGVRLSGGQRQRIGIARALYREPSLLIFDEATSALDNDTEAAIMEAINTLKGEKTMLIIAHRLTTIEGCDKIYRVKDGKIVRER